MNPAVIEEIASCDSQGCVYITDSDVYRYIKPRSVKSVIEIIKLIGTGVAGIIETEVCADDAVPAKLKKESNSQFLKHRRIARISYPHEWCATMLQDAASFHLSLSVRLLGLGIHLKDAHPWNILFERGQPIFVDFTSLVTNEGLLLEDYLESNYLHKSDISTMRLSKNVKEIFFRMYQPYFINPLILYACKERDYVRKRIEETTLNASSSSITRFECLSKRHAGSKMLKRFWLLIKARIDEGHVCKGLRVSSDINKFYEGLQRIVQRLPVSVGVSAYTDYYRNKGEDQGVTYSSAWNAKQKSVYEALNSPDIHSVLDVACNTGWYALMAEKLGKSVVAFDTDEACIETLYKQVRDARLNVLPLVMNFVKLTKNRYSIYDGRKILISATQRLRSNSVIALGIIHHLVLGLGLSFEDVLNSLVELCDKQLVIEFVDSSDAMIQNHPDFFPAYINNKTILSAYKMKTLISLIERRGFNVVLKASYPETRKILVCNR